MHDDSPKTYTAFKGTNRIASGALIDVALAVRAAMDASPGATFLTFGDATGGVVDLDLRGTTAEIVARLAPPSESADQSARGRGRPKLGVVPREVTLLPRHWDWLGQQPGGASQALRRLIDQARREDGGRSRTRAAQAAAYQFMAAMAGNLPGFEEATRALFAGDRDRFAEQTRAWPPDVRSYAETLMRNGTAEARDGESTAL